ncbi:MAG: HEPN domain-containing protein [Patescibacteria group bacterium]|nr:HEPN domain-containing protein [Patescibacteria group bacterium]
MDKNIAFEWFASANSDYKYAEIGLKEDAVFPQIAFLSQQIAEKFLKGFLIFYNCDPPRIHELPKLLDECVKINAELEKLRDSCEILTGFYIDTRYPPNIPDYTKDDIKEVFNHAKFIKQTIERIIQKQD